MNGEAVTTKRTLRAVWQRTMIILGAAAIATSAIVAAPATVAPTSTAEAVTGSDFNPGMIIADSVFYNSSAMTVAQIQSFLQSKVPNCRSGYVCLKDFRQNTTSQTVKSEGCAAYAGVAGESAAQIIYKVATACKINPQSLLVLLEKEQSLVTDDWPGDRQYRSATGYGCPDTADCDINYYGFFNQVYNAAWQFKKYQARPLDRGYIAGRTNSILYHPNSSCGRSDVYIQNQATAGLYIYTPYRPNQAALNNLYGTGDGCSAYGNRNFWRIFNDWFGSTTGAPSIPEVRGGILTEWKRTGAGSGPLGNPLAVEVSITGGVKQEFAGGTIYWTSTYGAFTVGNGPVRTAYLAASGPAGKWGFPTGNGDCSAAGGCFQNFMNGRAYVKSDGSAPVYLQKKLVTEHDAAGGAAGALKYPKSAETATTANGGGSVTEFDGGTIYSSPRGTITLVNGPVRTAYVAASGPAGKWGWPAGKPAAQTGGGTYQLFTGGHTYWSSGTGAHIIGEKLNAAYKSLGGPGGSLGYPTSGESAIAGNGGGVVGQFQKGTLYSSKFGTMTVQDKLQAAYTAAGGPAGAWGWPAAAPKTGLRDGGVSQAFSNATVFASAKTAPQSVKSKILSAWSAVGHTQGTFGYPTEPEKAVAGGVTQKFQNGTIYQSDAATRAVPAYFDSAYVAAGGAGKTWGWPTGAASCTLKGSGCVQEFTNGQAFYKSTTGARFVKPGTIQTEWIKAGHVNGRYGFPTSDEKASTANGGGVSQSFSGGTLYAKTGMTAREILPQLRAGFIAAGAESGAWGWPLDAGACNLVKSGCKQRFTNGTVFMSAGTTPQLMSGAILAEYSAQGGPAGALGYPSEPARAYTQNGGGTSQKFQGGNLFSSRFGTFQVFPAILTAYEGASGPNGAWSWPTSKVSVAAGGGYSQSFQGGQAFYKPGTGAHLVHSKLFTEWVKRGFLTGSLGYPKATATVNGNLIVQQFEKGSLELNTTTGKFRVF
ncbi:hypothetical protein ACFVAJ_17745 [Agromyces sp. NPDC057679]|uniref:hypothetical protein n=1 Tax=Agromyces sp. NPDC057679 TaxID=3346207 RepID=UPI00367284FC